MSAIRSGLKAEIEAICPGNVISDVSMADLSSWKVGGRAALLVKPSNLLQIRNVRKLLSKYDVPSLVIGNTTNLLFTDEDIQAVVIQLGNIFSEVTIVDDIVTAQAGVWVPKLARRAMLAGLKGLEHTCGIPGTLGGLLVMNGGSQRKCIGERVSMVETVDVTGNVRHYTNDQCEFAYRHSVFQKKDEVITKIVLKLDSAFEQGSLRSEMLDILRSRRAKFPRKIPNCGSVFVSDPTMYVKYGPPGKIIESCGLKGTQRGGAQVSLQHANFIVNQCGGALARDILYLIQDVRESVYEKTGYMMCVEPRFVNSSGDVQVI